MAHFPSRDTLLPLAILCLSTLAPFSYSQEAAPPEETPPAESPASGEPRGSLMEDRAARKLLEAGDLRLAANEVEKAVEIWQSVIERYPKSRVRFIAHMKLGEYYLEKERAFDRARVHFEIVTGPDNPDPEQQSAATLKLGVTYYESRLYGKAFTVFRDIIKNYPGSPQVNEAWYYIGLGHFKQGHYSRAIEALEKVGTSLSGQDAALEKIEAGKRLFLRIDDRDLAILEPGQGIKVTCQTKSGDKEVVECVPLGRGTLVVLGTIATRLGTPQPGNGLLEIRGGDEVQVIYIDEFSANNSQQQQRLRTVGVVGTAQLAITDGSFADQLEGVVIGKPAFLQATESDSDTTDAADKVTVTAEIWRPKTTEEWEAETADKIAAEAANATDPAAATPPPEPADAAKEETEIDPAESTEEKEEEEEVERYKLIDSVSVELIETVPTPQAAADPAAEAPAVEDKSIHSGIFRGEVMLEAAREPVSGDKTLQTAPGDQLRVTYVDEINPSGKPRTLLSIARCVEGNLGDVRVTKSEITDGELRLQTLLETAGALTNIGNHYKEFGLADKAALKYTEALTVCEEVVEDAKTFGGPILEKTYVQLWRTYFALDQVDLAAAVCTRLIRDFPESAFIDEAVLQQALVARKQGEFGRAISLFSSLLKIEKSNFRGEAQFGMGEVYEEMAAAATGEAGENLYEQAFQAYKEVYEKFPESGRVGDAVARMANFYYQKKDYARAIDVFESVLEEHPDANFLDVILFNYGRCLYRLDRKQEARVQFDHLLAEFPDSPLAQESRQISDALEKAGF